MARLRVIGVVMSVVAIGAFALPGTGRPTEPADRHATLSARTPVPESVMSVLRSACFDCHSDETRWPWYAQLPIASHVIERDVVNGRAQLNWSQWENYNRFDRAGMLDKVCDKATTGEMPPWQYRLLHPDARLAATEIVDVCAWARREAERLTQEGS